MRYGLAAWGLREESLESQLKITAGLGLDLLEFSIANYDKDPLQIGATDEQIEQVKALFRQYNVRLECGCTGNDFTGDDVDAQVCKVSEVIDIASKLGIRYLRIFAGFNSDSVVYGDRLNNMLAALKTVNDHAKTKQVVLCVETHGGVTALDNGALVHFNSVTTRTDLWKEILKTGVSIAYDPANLGAVGATCPAGFYKQFKDRIDYVHLKDFRDVEGGVLPAACGEGRLDWKRLMETLRSFSGPAMIEYELPDDVKEGMTRSLEFLKTNEVNA
ncbi:MAG: sugar phosphate isomerase/epimerase family protein [Victivallales bacterium]|jgi:xylose isomerase domain protein TIM barrel